MGRETSPQVEQKETETDRERSLLVHMLSVHIARVEAPAFWCFAGAEGHSAAPRSGFVFG